MKLSRFSLRTMLIAVAIIAAGVGYVAQQARIVSDRYAFMKKHPCLRAEWAEVFDGEATTAPWLLRLLGAKSIAWISVYNQEDAAQAKRLFPESDVFEIDPNEEETVVSGTTPQAGLPWFSAD